MTKFILVLAILLAAGVAQRTDTSSMQELKLVGAAEPYNNLASP
jgi:hypothetical protein